MQIILNHRVTVSVHRFLTILLVCGFVFSNSAINISQKNLLQNGQSGLENVIKNLRSFSDLTNAKEASHKMKAMVIALQSASGLLVTKQLDGEENGEVIAVFFKLPFLASAKDTVAISRQCIDLANNEWINIYSSINIPPPSPPPLLLA